MSQVTKQLKKNDFLAVILATAMTRGQVVEALSEYTFIPTYLDYLTDHFVAQGKIVKNEDGTIQLKPGKKAASGTRTKHRVVEVDGNYTLESLPLEKGEHITKDSGWYATAGKAVKVTCSAIFKNYIESTKAVKSLVAVGEVAEESAE